MKAFLWKQFSSNHSANFEIVSTFKTVELAHQTAEMLREAFRAIALEQMAYEDYCHDCPPTYIELSLAKQYGLEWSTYSLDWLVLDGDDVRNITELDQFVFVTNLHGDNTWMGAPPIDQLLRNLGGDIIVTGEFNGGEAIIEISCKAPDEATARRLNDQLKSYWDQVKDDEGDLFDDYVIPPWINFWTGGEHILSNIWEGNVEELVNAYLAEALPRKQYLAEHAAEVERLRQEIIQANNAGDLARHERLLQEYIPHVQYIPPQNHEVLPLDQALMALDAIFDTHMSGAIDRQGVDLIITKLPTYKVGRGLPSLVGFLRYNGCFDVQYKVSSKY